MGEKKGEKKGKGKHELLLWRRRCGERVVRWETLFNLASKKKSTMNSSFSPALLQYREDDAMQIIIFI